MSKGFEIKAEDEDRVHLDLVSIIGIRNSYNNLLYSLSDYKGIDANISETIDRMIKDVGLTNLAPSNFGSLYMFAKQICVFYSDYKKFVMDLENLNEYDLITKEEMKSDLIISCSKVIDKYYNITASSIAVTIADKFKIAVLTTIISKME